VGCLWHYQMIHHMEKFLKILFVAIFALIRCIIGVGLCISIGVLIAHFLCNIQPQETYSWMSGIWHGAFLVPNFIRGLFSPEILCKAKDFTTMYNVLWWISVVLLQGPIIVMIVIAPFLSLYLGINELK